uniref:RNA-dependent RNA polymerase n=1 Tax=papaya mottle-associated virus TaxID=3071214 RepID=A0A6G7S6U4_9VIRU|nr:RNA-dependent RNA polymerase [papaya mottle-associated virus]
MALTYRTPMEDIVASFEPAMQNAIASTAANGYKLMEERNFSIANYKMDSKSKEKLSQAGIYLSPFSAVVHSHPVCKTLENYLLYSVLPNYINNKFLFVGIKDSKLSTLKTRDPRLNLVESINRYVTSADMARYSQEFTTFNSKPHESLKRHKLSLEGATLRDLVPAAMAKKGKNFFLHDELHYWGKQDLMTFLEVFGPEMLLATVVIPPELLIGATQSLNPWCYKFQIIGNNLLFFPDGERSEGYEQPLSGRYILKTNEINLLNGETYCVDIICSKFAHHLVCISKGRRKTNKYRCFGNFEAVSFEKLKSLSTMNQSYFPISFEVTSKIFRYLVSLKKPDLQSAIAKLSQIVAEPNCNEIKFVTEFAQLVISSGGVNSLLNPDRLKIFFSKFYKKSLPDWLSTKIKAVRDVSLEEFMRDLEPLSLTIELETLERGFFEDLFENDGFEAESYIDVPELIEERFQFGSGKNEKHIGKPYVGIEVDERKPEPILIINADKFIHRAAVLFRNSFLNAESRFISKKTLEEFILMLCSSNKMLLSALSLEVQGLKMEDFIDKIIKRIKALMVNCMRPTFNELRMQWFLMKRRLNTRCICNYAEFSGVSKTLERAWSKIVLDIPKVGNSLRKAQKDWEEVPSDKQRKPTVISTDKFAAPEVKCCSQIESIEVPMLKNGFEFIADKYPLGKIVVICNNEGEEVNLNPQDQVIEEWPEWLTVWCQIMKIPDGFNRVMLQKTHKTHLGCRVEEVKEEGSRFKILVNIRGESQVVASCSKQIHMVPITEELGAIISQTEEEEKNHPILASQSSEAKVTIVLYKGPSGSKPAKKSDETLTRVREDDSKGAFNQDEIERAFEAKSVSTFSLLDEVKVPESEKDQLPGRTASFYSRNGEGYQYKGGNHKSLGWGLWLEDAIRMCKLNPEAFDHCLVQRYSKGGKIGFHSDDEPCYPKGNAILTINVTGACKFGTRRKEGKDSCDFFLLNGSQILIMPFGFQESHKHSVGECSEGRISMTFRSTNADQRNLLLSRKNEEEIKVNDGGLIEIGIEEVEEIGNMSEKGRFRSLFDYFSDTFEYNSEELFSLLGGIEDISFSSENERFTAIERTFGREIFSIIFKFMSIRAVNFSILVPELSCCFHLTRNNGAKENALLMLDLQELSFVRVLPKNICVLTAISECWGRKIEEVLRVMEREDNEGLYGELIKGRGISIRNLGEVFKIFSIRANIIMGDRTFTLNENGTICGSFKIDDDHLNFIKMKKDPCARLLKRIDVGKQFSKELRQRIKALSSELPFCCNFKRASLLADSFHGASTGVLLSELFNGEKNYKEVMCNKNGELVKIFCILGTFGCGKSYLFKSLIKGALGKKFDLVTPRRALLEEIKKDIDFQDRMDNRRKRGQEGWFLSTFEKFIKRTQFLVEGQVVFIDEIQLYPPGYLDLILSLAPSGVMWVVFGDPCQSDYHSEKDEFILSQMPSNVEVLLRDQTFRFNIQSCRFQNRNFIGRLPCDFSNAMMNFDEPYLLREGLEALSELEPKYKEVVLVSSFEEKKIVEAYCTNAKKILTFGESTGLTFNWGTVLITLISERTNDKRWLTALSRFRRNICLINSTGYSTDNLLTSYKDRCLGRFFSGTASKDNILGMLEGKALFYNGFDSEQERTPIELHEGSSSSSESDSIDLDQILGRDEGIREEKLGGDPWLKGMIDLFQIEDFQEVEMQKVEEAISEFKVHLPREELEGTRTRWVHKILAKEFREHRIGSLISTQFTDEHSKQAGAIQLTNAAERFESIYPRHRSNDTVTFLMAVKKRLRFSKPHIEKGKLLIAKGYGRFMLNQFLKKVPLKRNRDQVMFEKARQDFFDKKTSKSAATIENHNIRSCRDWLLDMTQVFSKSQLCTKFDNRFRSAKAAQTIVCFQHAVLCRFAPYMRYIEMKLKESLPKKYYIHSGKGLDELNDWVIKNKFDGTCTESDYEAFDASQDQYIVAFELELMRYLGLPNDLIADYEFIKLHLGSKLGSFAIMRFTGEASTFLFNTMANMLFTFLRYDIKGNESICFAGDDMCSSKRLTVKREFESFLSMIKLKAKVQHTKNPTFCGWHLCPEGIYKKPQLVFERMCIARETNNLHNCIDNYAIEVSYAYRKGELITARMDEEELGAYYGCVRTIIKHKHLLKSDVKKLFEGATM